MKDVIFKDEKEAIEDAVRDGVLSNNPAGDNFAGHFTYMGHFLGVGKFKHKVASLILEHHSASQAAAEQAGVTFCRAATGE